MEQLLFSVFLEQAVSRMAGFFADILCPHCETPQPTSITNVTHNYFFCPQCGYGTDQFANLTHHTLNRDHSISSAGVANVVYNVSPTGEVEVSNALTTAHAKHHPLIIETRFGLPGQKKPFYTARSPKHLPRLVRERTQTSVAVPVKAIPLRDTPIVMDLAVYNEWGDLLDHRHTQVDSITLFAELIWLNMRILENEHKRLTLELKQLEAQQRQLEQRYRELVLMLVERMPRH